MTMAKSCQSTQKTREMLHKMTLIKKLYTVAISDTKVDKSTRTYYQQPIIVIHQLKHGRSEEHCFSQYRRHEQNLTQDEYPHDTEGVADVNASEKGHIAKSAEEDPSPDDMEDEKIVVVDGRWPRCRFCKSRRNKICCARRSRTFSCRVYCSSRGNKKVY